MKQVTFVNDRLRRNMRRLDERRPTTSHSTRPYCRSIAQAVVARHHAVKDPTDRINGLNSPTPCGTRRRIERTGSSAQREAAEAALTTLTKSCEQCHAVFRKQVLPTKEQ